MPDPKHEAWAVIGAFWQKYYADRQAGTPRSVEGYVELFPSHSEEIRRAYQDLDAPTADLGDPVSGDVQGPSGPRLSGRRISSYQLVRELGHGGQGYVWEAEDLTLHRQVALKLLPHAASFSGKARLRFEREAEVTSKLEHPGLCTVYEVGEDDGIPFIAMQLVEGWPLDKRIKTAQAGAAEDPTISHVLVDPDSTTDGDGGTKKVESHALSPATPTKRREVFAICRLIESAARALHAAHEVGLIHRDVKPGNIMMTPEGKAVVLDFGLARDELTDGAPLTETGDFMGTPAYMSPEQLLAHRVKLDRRTDVYSLGVTLYECLTLRRPFHAPSREALYEAISQKDPEKVRQLNAAVPRDLEVVVETAMERERDRRYPTALEFADELRRVVSYEPIEARPAGPILRLRRWAQRSPATATAVTGVFLALALAAGVFFVQNQETKSALAKEKAALTKEKAAVADRDAALAKERAALTEKDAALSEKNVALEDYLRMSDVKRLRDAKAAVADLFPPHPDLVPKLTDWQEEYRETFENLASHEAALLRLREAAVAYAENHRKRDHAEAYAEIARLEAEQKEVEAKLKERESEKLEDRLLDIEDRLAELREAVIVRASWTFENDDLAFKHETLTQLVADLKSETGPKGVWPDITKRLEVSKTIKARTVDAFAEDWSETAEGIATSPKYGGLNLAPQIGLIPLGPDPSSGLFEFLHWLSHEPGAPLPVRNGKERFEVKEETGIILVLLPGGTFLMGAQSTDALRPNYDPNAAVDESPVHEVTLDAFLLGKYEVTQAQWFRIAGDRPSLCCPGESFGGSMTTSAHPVEMVSWREVVSGASRIGLLVPTEAQWEFGCRAGTETVWYVGNEKEGLQDHANIADAFCKANGGPNDWMYDIELDDGRFVHAPRWHLSPKPVWSF